MSNAHVRAQVTRRSFLRGVGLFGVTAALAVCTTSAGAEERSNRAEPSPLLAIIHTNDTHGHDVAVESSESSEGNLSMAAVAALKEQWEQKGYEVLLVDAGDAMQGMPLVDMSHGASAITFMNACGYDLMVPGNHEFDWGPDALAAAEQAASFPLVSANVLVKQTGELRFTPSKVFELRDGTRVGFFGLTTPMTAVETNPKNVANLEFLREETLHACAQAQVDDLRAQGCDLVVCVGHLGNLEESGASSSKAVLENVKGIDLFIDGHDHREVMEEVAGALLVETGCYMHNIGVVVIDEGLPSAELVAAGSYDGVDAAVQAIIDEKGRAGERRAGCVLGVDSLLPER